MKKFIVLLVCVCVLFMACTPKAREEAPVQETAAVAEEVMETVSSVSEQPAVVEEVLPLPAPVPPASNPFADEIAAECKKYAANPEHWTINTQKEYYDFFFGEGLLDEALEFRNFVESLAQYHHNEPVYEYNPVFLCYEKYPDLIPLVYEVKPDLFVKGNMNFGSWSKAPIVYVLENLGLEEVKFYFENNIPFLDVREDLLYGTMNRGGPRFGIGGNILTYAKDSEVIEYMISQGIPAEVEASEWFSYSLRTDTLDVHSTPGNDTEVIGTLTKGTPIKAISVLTYKVDGSKWMKISFNDTEGWIPDSGFNYDSGI